MLWHKLQGANAAAGLSYEYFGVQITNDPHTINYSEVGGVSTGDEVYIYLATASGGLSPPDIPTGYTSIAFDDNELANRLVYREIDGTEGASVSVSGRNDMCATMLKIVGGASRTVGSAFSDVRPDVILPQVTATAGLLFALGAARDRSSAYDLAWGSAPSGMTELLAQDSSGSGDSMLYALYVEDIGGGATGTRTLTVANGDSGDAVSGVLLNIYQ